MAPPKKSGFSRVFGGFALLWRYRGSVVPHTAGPLLIYTLYTALIVFLDKEYGLPFRMSDELGTILSIVVGLLLVFRTDTAYGRFWDGRNEWSNLTTTLGNIARLIWIIGPESTVQEKASKIIVLKHITAYAIAVKHHLRNEFGMDYDDLDGLLFNVPNIAGIGLIGNKKKQLPAEITFAAESESSLLLGASKSKIPPPPVSLPVVLMGHITKYVTDAGRAEKIGEEEAAGLIDNIGELTSIFTTLELTGKTPVPLAYSVHMSQTLNLYCLFLPFQLVGDLGWITVPVMMVAVFTFFGLDAIGEEISNPFGYDLNDLPVDSYCEDLKTEIEGYIFNSPPSISEDVVTAVMASYEVEKSAYDKDEEDHVRAVVDNYPIEQRV